MSFNLDRTNCQKHLGCTFMRKEKILRINRHWSDSETKVYIYFQVISLLQYINHLSDLILITVVLCMINPIMKASVIELRRCNTMLLWQLQVLLEELHKPKSKRNMGLNHLNSEKV